MSVEVSTISNPKNYVPTATDEEVYYPSTVPDYMPENNIHFVLIANLALMLQTFLQREKRNYVFGDVMFYYEKGNPRKFVAPDLMICLNKEREPSTGVYKLWEEQAVPQVVIEICSESTWDKDLTTKFALYERLGVQEYYIFDVEYKCLREPLMAYHRQEDGFVKVEVVEGRVFSRELCLELVDTGETLRLFDPQARRFLMTMEEMAARLAELEAQNK